MTQYLDDRSWGNFSLKPLVEEVVQSLASSISDHSIAAVIDIPAELRITADRKLLLRAVHHLMLNAIEAMPMGGSLVATSAVTAGAVELEIADAGPAATDEARHSVEMVRRIMELLDGSVSAVNCPEGGAAYTLRLSKTVALEAAA
jgi:signal transduction histidine kinase